MTDEKILGADAAEVDGSMATSADTVAPHAASLYQRVRHQVAVMDATRHRETTKEQYLKRVIDDVTLLVMAETLLAVGEHCEKRSNELWATGLTAERNFAAAYSTLQDWCADQIESVAVTVSEAGGSVPSEAQKDTL